MAGTETAQERVREKKREQERSVTENRNRGGGPRATTTAARERPKRCEHHGGPERGRRDASMRRRERGGTETQWLCAPAGFAYCLARVSGKMCIVTRHKSACPVVLRCSRLFCRTPEVVCRCLLPRKKSNTTLLVLERDWLLPNLAGSWQSVEESQVEKP